MGRKKPNALEAIVRTLPQAKPRVGNGKTAADAMRAISVTDLTYCR